jgi:hypothetical protein
MPTPRLPAPRAPFVPFLIVAVIAAACGGSPGASASPGATPSDAIDHPTGATDVVLRYDEAGGMMLVEWFHAHVPFFTLYGDGTVIYAPLDLDPGFEAGNPTVARPLRTMRLTPDQVQQLLVFALRDGGLAAAKLRYDNPLVADASTAVFTVSAGGVVKTVEAVGLGIDAEPGPDSAVKGALLRLAERLRDFDRGGTVASEVWEPDRYRGVLFEAGGAEGLAVRPWPWEAFGPATFVAPANPNGLQVRTRALSPAEVAVLGLGEHAASAYGIHLDGGGVPYSLVIRALLPDEPVVPGR